MFWVLVFLVLAVGGIVFLAFHVRSLVNKATDVFSELQMLQARVAELGDLVAQIRIPDPTALPDESANEKVSAR